MPLSRFRNRQRMRLQRAKSVQPKLKNVSLQCPTVPLDGQSRPNVPVQPRKADLQAMIHNIEQTPRATSVQPSSDAVPWYNPEIHTTGDKVKQFRNGYVEVVTL
jgi:hypothetical protein